MARSRLTPVFVVLVALTLFVSGMLAYKLAIGSPAHPAAIWGGSSAKSDSFSIEGRALIQVYRADGTLSATWRGHNDLTPFGKNAIAGLVRDKLGSYHFFIIGVAAVPVLMASFIFWLKPRTA